MATVVMRKQHRSPVDGTGLRHDWLCGHSGPALSSSLFAEPSMKNARLMGSDHSKHAWPGLRRGSTNLKHSSVCVRVRVCVCLSTNTDELEFFPV